MGSSGLTCRIFQVFAIATNLQDHLASLINSGVSPLEVVVVEEHPDYPGELVFQVFEGQDVFYTRYRDWLSVYSVLSEIFNLPAFVTELTKDGWEVVFGPSCEKILADMVRWSEPLHISGYELYPFQQFSLRRAFETDFWFFNWATGAGKSFACAAGAKELLRRGEIDVVIMCTLSKSKLDQRRFFEHARLDVVVNDGTKPKRTKGYAERHQVYVMNYEKLWVDDVAIQKLVSGQRVLWIFDECHKIITADKQNKARQAYEKLARLTASSKTWPMSASVVNGNPLRFRDVFALGKGRHNPLGPKYQFENDYADKVTVVELTTPTGKKFPLVNYDWNLGRLQNIRHRVGAYTQTARKTDPGIAEHFKGLATILLPVEASPEEIRLNDFIIDEAWEAYQADPTVNLGPYYHLLRATANTPEALRHTTSEIVKDWDIDKLIGKGTCAKLERLNEQLESIRESGDQVLVFTHWTSLTLHLIKDKLTVPYVAHWGTGQSEKESQRVKDEFKANPDITCFLTSDAGSHGLNMQNARYVIQYEPTYSYDDGMQRASRIDRSDSHLDGLTNYVMITEGSVEERVWDIQQSRRIISSAVQGTQEVLSYGVEDLERAKLSESANFAWLIFGDRV